MRTVLMFLTVFLFIGSAQSQVDPRSYCDHPLYPILQTIDGGSTWHYLSGDEMIERAVLAISPVDPSSAIAVLNNTSASSEGSLPTLVGCTSEGLSLILPDQFTFPLPIGDGDLEIRFSVGEQEGLLLPAAPINVDQSWPASYEMAVAIVKSDEIKARFTASVEVESTVLGNNESISVPAGDFNAWLIEKEFTVTYKIGLRSLPPMTIVHSWYLVDGIGLVKQVADRIPLELESYELPESEL